MTATPAPAAQCPKEDPSLAPDFRIPDVNACLQALRSMDCFPGGMETKYLDFLNRGGSPENLLKLYAARIPGESFYQDVTGDGVPDLMLYDSIVFKSPHIYYCAHGRYQKYDAFAEYGGYSGSFIGVQDLNADNIPEIIFTQSDCSGSGCFGISNLEWDGQTFQDLSPTIGTWGALEWHIQDGANGTKEIVLAGDRPGT